MAAGERRQKEVELKEEEEVREKEVVRRLEIRSSEVGEAFRSKMGRERRELRKKE